MPLQAEAARQGHGMALLPCILGDSDSRLVRVPNTSTISNLPAWLLTHPGLRRMERVRVFARTITSGLEQDHKRLSGELSMTSST